MVSCVGEIWVDRPVDVDNGGEGGSDDYALNFGARLSSGRKNGFYAIDGRND